MEHLYHTPPPKTQRSLQKKMPERVWDPETLVDKEKVSSEHNRVAAYMNSACTSSVQAQVSPIPRKERKIV